MIELKSFLSSTVSYVIFFFRLTVVTFNSYIDFEDYETPVKTYVSDRFSYQITPGSNKCKLCGGKLIFRAKDIH